MTDLRFPLHLVPESIRNLSPYVPPGGGGPVKLDANEIPFSLPADMRGEIDRALAGADLNRYPDPLSKGLRRAFAARYGCGEDCVMAGNGSDELIALLLWAFRAPRSTSAPVVMVPTPTFAMYALGGRAAGFEVFEVPFRSDLRVDLAGFLAGIEKARPNILFLSSPNNPTGTVFSAGEIEDVLAASEGLVVVDEAYADYSREPSWADRVEAYGNLAVLRTLSKVGAAALRCGFLVAGRHVLDEINKIRPPFNISSLTQAAGEIILRRYDDLRDQISLVTRERERLTVELRSAGYEAYPSAANFLLVRAAGREEKVFRFLQRAGIMVKFLPGLPVTGDALRITVGSPEENQLLVNRLNAFTLEGEQDEIG